VIVMSFWACARVQSFCERIAQRHLERIGFPTYAPRTAERVRIHGKRVTRTALLFPSYIFVEVELQFHQIYRTPGIVQLIGNGAGPGHVPERVITQLRARERNGIVELEERQLKPGVQIRILTGPFANHLGIFSDQTGHERVAVLLAILGAQHRVSMPKNNIEVARP
jgi:transcription elongation factor/antiterminator RfaH